MPTISVRLDERDARRVRELAEAQGLSVSDLVRRSLGLMASQSDERLDDLDRRVSRLEEMAGL